MSGRCTVCGCGDDVREDGICAGCYMVRLAEEVGLSYGKAYAKYGNNWGRGRGTPLRHQYARRCPVCGVEIIGGSRRKRVCSTACQLRWDVIRRAERTPTRKTCRGCRWLVDGSSRCTCCKSPHFGTDWGRACMEYARRRD